MVAAQHPQELEAPLGAPQPSTSSSGLKPIARLVGEDRIKRIVPETAASAQVTYSSVYVRDFLRSAYNFCSSKFSVARSGKTRALDEKFREAELWFEKAIAWHANKSQTPIPIETDTVEVQVTHPLSGRLIRLLNQHDRLFALAIFARVANSISALEFEGTMKVAGSKIASIHQSCIPDNDRFAADGAQDGDTSAG